jgi:cytochrome c oxidase subunit III
VPDTAAMQTQGLPVGSRGRLSSGWWGMWALIATEAALFSYLLFSYFYVEALSHGPWPAGGVPKMQIALPDTIILIAGSVTMWWAERGVRTGRRAHLRLGILATLVLGIVFLGLQMLEWRNKPFSLATNAYSSLYFTITGFHMAHVLAGLVILAFLLVWALLGYFDERRHSAVSIGTIYWHFVTVVWLFVFATIYVTPYLGLAR